MDYLVGFLFGYFGRVFYNALKDLSTSDYFYKTEDEYYPLTEDDLP